MSSSPSKEEARHGRRPRRKRVMVRRPEPGSLYDIMHDNNGLSLYIAPICWSDIHVRLLGVRFRELPAMSHPLPGPALRGWDDVPQAATANDLARWLTTIISDDLGKRWLPQLQAVRSVMKTMFPDTLHQPKTNAKLSLYFGDRMFQNVVSVPVLWKDESGTGASFDSAVTQKLDSSSDPTSTNSQERSSRSGSPDSRRDPLSRPVLAYLDRKQLESIRQNLYRIQPGPDKKPNTPVQSLQQLRSKQLLPANENMDAHYLAILLAMAQSPFYSDCAKTASQGPILRFGGGKLIDEHPTQFHDITVRLITHADDSADFIVYTVDVSATFLERFAHPTKAPTSASDPGLDITYQRVPVWPILGLKERLAGALGQEIAGSLALTSFGVESNDLETYLSYTEQLDRTIYRQIASKNSAANKKRRRRTSDNRPLSEVVNSSFEDDASSNLSGASSQKSNKGGGEKRLSEDLPVLSPDAKRRCQRVAGNPLTVC
ncbi:hypothetical protein GE09DRAFT_1166798 [Coniochaeta sp. 2T2.1]|nr:hypothetical protein GE09DRAFT_1166798 [Coniochaeta sp. 2T2.1]